MPPRLILKLEKFKFTSSHKTETGCDGLIRWDAGHGDSVGRDPVRKTCTQGSFTCNVASFYFLNIKSVVNSSLFTNTLDKILKLLRVQIY